LIQLDPRAGDEKRKRQEDQDEIDCRTNDGALSFF